MNEKNLILCSILVSFTLLNKINIHHIGEKGKMGRGH